MDLIDWLIDRLIDWLFAESWNSWLARTTCCFHSVQQSGQTHRRRSSYIPHWGWYRRGVVHPGGPDGWQCRRCVSHDLPASGPTWGCSWHFRFSIHLRGRFECPHRVPAAARRLWTTAPPGPASRRWRRTSTRSPGRSPGRRSPDWMEPVWFASEPLESGY